MSTAEIIARLNSATQKLDQARSRTAAAAQDAAEARAEVAAALQGSAAGPLIAQIEQVRENLAKVAQGVGTAKQNIDRTIVQAKALGN
jgi:hypothetical protein